MNRTTHLPFRPVIPAYLPKSTDPLPAVAVAGDSVALNYHDVVVEQATKSLPKRHDVPPNEELSRDDSIDGTSVSVTERHVTSVWAEIEHSWRTSHVFFRLTYIKSGSAPTADTALEYALVDDAMRHEARKIALSMIKQVEN
jgi:hypothetical protein